MSIVFIADDLLYCCGGGVSVKIGSDSLSVTSVSIWVKFFRVERKTQTNKQTDYCIPQQYIVSLIVYNVKLSIWFSF